MAKAKNIRLLKLRDGKRALGRIFNEAYNDTLPEGKAKTLTYIVNSFIKACEMADLEKRVEQIEILLNDKTAS